MTATVRFTITKPHDVTLRARAVAVDDGSVQHEQEFAAGSCECMSDEFVVHAGVMLEVFEGGLSHSDRLNDQLLTAEIRVRELEQQAAKAVDASLNDALKFAELESANVVNVKLTADMSEVQSQLTAAQARITELESANAAAQARAVKQRGK